MKFCIIGLGYVGLVATAYFVEMLYIVFCVDIYQLKENENFFIDAVNQFNFDFIENKDFKYLQMRVKE